MLGYREQQVLIYARRVIAERGVAPTYNMIREETGISTRGEVSRIVASLERRGYLRRAGAERVRRIGIGTFMLTMESPAMG
jgi:SOS-response transcriptional repressor LexA